MGSGFKRGSIQIRYVEEAFYNACGEAPAQVAQRGGRCPIPGNIKGPLNRALSNVI